MSLKTTRFRSVLAAAAVSVTLSASAAYGASCATPAEKVALETRVMQSDLMVAALACGEKARYNAFVKKFQPVLVDRGKTLQAYFRRMHGGAAKRRLNSFITQLANMSSQRSLEQATLFCAQAGDLFSQILAVEPNKLATFAALQPHATSHGVSYCDEQAIVK